MMVVRKWLLMRLPLYFLILATTIGLSQQPTFRSGIDLIRVDVTVLDKDGNPVTDLSASDFRVAIDGSPRRVAAARLYGAIPDEPKPAIGVRAPGAYATNRDAAPGRIVIFVVDLESMSTGHERVLLETAASMVNRLSPADAVGLLPIPGKGLEITKDHATVRGALAALKGAAPHTFQRHTLSVADALGFEHRDRRIINEVVERECRQYEPECPMDLRNESNQLLLEARRRQQVLLTTLTTLNSRLKPIGAPKDVVVISAGLPFDQESITYVRDLQRAAAESGVSTHVVQLAQPDTDASSQRVAGTGALPAGDLRLGLSTLAGATAADFFEGVGRAAGPFDRIANEITRSWQLAVEATQQDVDGKTHKINVSVSRPGATARSRRELMIAVPAGPLNAVELVAQPVDAVELPVAVAAYTVRGDDASTLKQIVLIEAGGIGTDAAPVYAFAVIKGDHPVFQTNGELTVAGQTATTVTAAQLAPGQYRLRLGVVDSARRGGSLDMPLSVGLRAGSALQFSDVLVGTAGDRFTPGIQIAAGAPCAAMIEVYAGDPAAFAELAVEFELRRSGSDAVLKQAAANVNATNLPGRQIAQAPLQTGGLTAGDYTVSAIVRSHGAAVGRVSRAFYVVQ